MQNEFKIGDYVYAEDWCYGKIVYLTDKYAEVDFDTMRGGGSLTFSLEDLKHAEPPKRRLNYGREEGI
jgi:hypothetical protein